MESPSLFNQILKKNLKWLELPCQSTLVQYIDDLLIASRTRDECKHDSIALLNHLGEYGYKASPVKLQYCQKSVKYFGHQIEKGLRRISRERITMILQRNPPTSQRDVRMFMGMVGYCGQWSPNFAEIAKPLQQLTHKGITDPNTLEEDQMKAFTKLRESLCRAPALGMPDYTKPFTLFCHERDACSLSVLTQVHGGAYHPVAYFSDTLDLVAAVLPGCLHAEAAVGQNLSQCEGVVMGYPLMVMVPHSVEILLTRTKTQYLTEARLTRYETSILGALNVTLKRCTVLNPATLLPSDTVEIEKEEDIDHDCLEVTELCEKPRPDIRDTRLEENDQIVFDGLCLRDGTGTLRAGYVVCTITGTLEASWLPGVYSAQVAEVIALTRACYVSARLRVTIYTDSQYGFGIVHDFGQLWSQRDFMNSTETPMRNGDRIKELLYAIQLPEEIAVVKCSAHQKTQDYISLRNRYADQVTRFCTLNCISFKDKCELMPEEETNCASFALKIIDTLEELEMLQESADREEKKLLLKFKCVQKPEETWVSEEGQMVLPNSS
ncbi:hypothetical protein NDU88_004152 [Pleurodeles waltl]|uniref:ribonuclease H n=1 Tax=Pleurodeles waltl TaxID=8319 RepID=A0AAV7MT55_PLEWA|nr:hypothetical protein NDU88_004152 [Pleurodeles waltl]